MRNNPPARPVFQSISLVLLSVAILAGVIVVVTQTTVSWSAIAVAVAVVSVSLSFLTAALKTTVKKQLGSSPELQEPVSTTVVTGQDLVFKTLRVRVERVAQAQWQIQIRVGIINMLKDPIVIDDIHTIMYARLYEKIAGATKQETGDYRGKIPRLNSSLPSSSVVITYNNSLFREGKTYSLESGDGYELVLLFEVTSLEGTSGIKNKQDGVAHVVFGLFLDYYVVTVPGIKRRSIPSDCIYIFTVKEHGDWEKLAAVDVEKIKYLKAHGQGNRELLGLTGKLEAILVKHLSGIRHDLI